jgi:hypothetical protein
VGVAGTLESEGVAGTLEDEGGREVMESVDCANDWGRGRCYTTVWKIKHRNSVGNCARLAQWQRERRRQRAPCKTCTGWRGFNVENMFLLFSAPKHADALKEDFAEAEM